MDNVCKPDHSAMRNVHSATRRRTRFIGCCVKVALLVANGILLGKHEGVPHQTIIAGTLFVTRRQERSSRWSRLHTCLEGKCLDLESDAHSRVGTVTLLFTVRHVQSGDEHGALALSVGLEVPRNFREQDVMFLRRDPELLVERVVHDFLQPCSLRYFVVKTPRLFSATSPT